jgi:predicted AlkP superfamily pyrophosphatase or phosphodiesterase
MNWTTSLPSVRRAPAWIGLLVPLWALGPPSATAAQAPDPDPVPVTVLLVVDQLRADLLDRYDEVFTGGLRRLRDGGFRFTAATHDHSITLTAPGHATLSTGTHPSRHGVVANLWIENGVVVENIVDPSSSAVGAPGRPGTSLDRLMRSTVAEWLEAAHPDARLLSVSGKARAAALMMGRAAGTVLWFDAGAGRFVTSETWAEEYPDWVDGVHRDELAALMAERVWDLELPDGSRRLARADEVPYEADGVHTTFPHAFEDVAESWGGDWAAWWASTPALDRATLLVAMAGIEGEELGVDDVPDLLMISLSGTDRVGHEYGPRSLEQLDNLYRLDTELGAFMDWMDARFGSDGWRMVLTADHGVADAPEQAEADGRAGLRVGMVEAVEFEGRLSAAATAPDTDPAALPEALARAAVDVPWIEQAWTFEELLAAGGESPDSFTVLQSRSTYPSRLTGLLGQQGIEMRFYEGSLLWTVPRGTTHGSPYMYDRHVPFVVFGAGVPGGRHDGGVATVDVAPTLARLLGIEAPEDLDGVARPIG